MKKVCLICLCLIWAAACGGLGTNSPSSALKTFLEAKVANDAAAQKKVLSKNSLKFLEETAKKESKTVDQLLTDDAGMQLKEIPEIGKEEISGDTATVEVRNPNTGEWEKMPFVKEDGQWKMALDKAFEEAMKKVQELIDKMPSNANTAVAAPNEKPDSKQ